MEYFFSTRGIVVLFSLSSLSLLTGLSMIVYRDVLHPMVSLRTKAARTKYRLRFDTLNLTVLPICILATLLCQLFLVSRVFLLPTYTLSLIGLAELVITAIVLQSSRNDVRYESLFAFVLGTSAAVLISAVLTPALVHVAIAAVFGCMCILLCTKLLGMYSALSFNLLHLNLSTASMLFWLIVVFYPTYLIAL